MRTTLYRLIAAVLCLAVAACTGQAERRPDDGAASTAVAPVEVASPAADAAATEGQNAVPPAGSAPAVAGDAVAVVNGEPIPLADFQRQAFTTQRFYVDQGLDANSPDGQRQLLYLRKQVLDDMLNQVLIDQAAREMGITVSAEEIEARMASYVSEFGGEEALAASLAQEGSTIQDAEAMERAAIIGQKLLERITADLPATAEAVHARHILCVEEAACSAALARLEAGEAFETVAAEVSQDPTSARRGGDLDWVSPGMLPSPQLEDEIFKLPPGGRSAVVKTDFGYHIIEVLAREGGRQMSADQMAALREKKLTEWLAERRAASTIVINVEDLRDLASAGG